MGWIIEIILELLVDIGLLREDIKHINKVKKQEQKDGIKRPLKKYALQPTMKILFSVMILSVVVGFFLAWHRDKKLYPEKTKNEIAEIAKTVEKWNSLYNTYPRSVEDLIKGRPLRKEWKTDEWGNKYYYKIDSSENTFSITSSGMDGEIGTEDDIKYEK